MTRGIEAAEHFGPRIRRWAARLGISDLAEVSVLGDGARCCARRAEYLGYAERLACGQSIGSGLVEGACEQVIGRRMKQTGARWRVRRANRMATLCCTLHGDTWKTYWNYRLN